MSEITDHADYRQALESIKQHRDTGKQTNERL